MKKFFCFIALLSLVLPPVFAQAEEGIVKVTVNPPAETLKPGMTVSLVLDVAIRAPYHINSDLPSDEFLIGTTVDFKSVAGVTFGRVTFPAAQMKRFGFSDKPLSIFEGTVQVAAEMTLAADFKKNEIVVEGAVGYQACDNQSCLPPADAAFKRAIPVFIEPSSAGSKAGEKKEPEGKAGAVKADAGQAGTEAKVPAAELKDVLVAAPPGTESKEKTVTSLPPAGAPETVPPAAEKSGKASSPSSSAAPTGLTGSDFGRKGLLLTFVLVFLGGLALNLTPCIYPIIPITVSYFGGQAKGRRGGVVLHAVLYVIGMATTYSVLGLVAAFTGSLFGAALTYPPVLIGIALIMAALALSMFDVYELRMPAFLNKAAGSSRKGYFGTFFMGLTVGIIAAPCIGPFVLGLLTYVGNERNLLLGFSLFFVLALGLGLPFLILGIFSGSLDRIPRSGAWMVWVRKIFGFILLAMALYFVKSLLPSPLYFNLGIALIALLAGIYLAWIEPTKTPGKVFPFIRNIFGVVFFILALILAVTGVRSHVERELNAKLQTVAGAGGQVNLTSIAWVPYSEEALTAALETGKPVFIDATADWCAACHELDRKTYRRPEIVAAAKDFVMLRADLTRNDDEKVKAFYAKFKAKGCPTLIFLKPDGTEMVELRGVGFENKDVFLGKMKRALELSGAR